MKRGRGQRFGSLLTRMSVLSALIALSAALSAWPAAAGEAPTPALSTDRKDYSPGEIVTMTGSNFLPGEVVTIAVQAPGRVDRFLTAVADATGSFTNTEFSPDEHDRQVFITAVATGTQSGPDLAAVTYFWDAVGAACPFTVDASLTASDPANSKFKTIQQAVAAIPNNLGPCTINIKAGTYNEAVIFDGVNSAATSSAAQIFIQPDSSNAGPVIVTPPNSTQATSYAFTFQNSKFVTLTGLTVKGSQRAGISFKPGTQTQFNADITIDGNVINGNSTSSATIGAIDIGANQVNIWIVNNLIASNGKMGVDLSGAGPIYIVNNTIAGNASGGVNAAGTSSVFLVNNLLVGNGTAPPSTGGSCSCGLQGGSSATGITLRNNMFYRNGNTTGGFFDVRPGGSVLHSTDSNNYFTCLGSGSGCTSPTALGVGASACTFTDCGTAHVSATEMFVNSSDFHLVAGSPAIDKGLNHFQNPVGTEWVPIIDVDDNPRPQDGDGDIVATTDIGYSETVSATTMATITSVASSAGVSSFGDSVTFTATVAASGGPAAGGTVSFYDGSSCGGVQIGAVQPLVSGLATITTSSLTIGGHMITACYSGAAGFASSSGTVTQTVKQASQTITVSSAAPVNAQLNATFNVTATASSGLPVAITVTGSCSGNGTGSATVVMASAPGACVVHYNQTGNGTYAAATEITNTTTSQTVTQTITVNEAAPASAGYHASFTVGATASSGLPVAITGTGSCSGGGTATATILMTSASGSCVVHYNQGGDASYSAAPEVTSSTTAQKAVQTIAVNPHAPATAVYNATFGVGATATSGLPVAITTTGVCSGTGTATASPKMTSGAGTCVVHYNQAGDDNYNAASEVTEQTAAEKATQSIAVSSHAPGSAVYNAGFGVGATATSGLPVAITTTATPAGVCSGSGSGAAAIQMTSGTGTCFVHYNQAGDDNYKAASEVTEQTAAEKATQTVVVSPHAPAFAIYSTGFGVGATATSGLSVAITTTPAGVCSGGGSKTAAIQMTSGTGTCVVHYNQAGDDNYKPASEVTEQTAAQKATQTILVGPIAPKTAVYSTSFTVGATATSGLPVAITTAPVAVCSGSGIAGASVQMTSGTGTCVVHYNQLGNDNYAPAAEVMESTEAQRASQLITVNPHAPGSAVYNTSFAVAATASSGLPVAISPAGVCSGDGSGTATVLMKSGTGACVVHYNQAGNANYNPASEITDPVNAAKSAQTIDFGPLGDKTVGDLPFDVSATATSGLPVTFSSQTPGTCEVAGSTVKILHSGICTVVASQPGNDNYGPAPDKPQSFGINMGPSVLWLGLKNSDDIGTQFDVRVEVLDASTSPNTLVASGEAHCITGLNHDKKKLKPVTVPMTGFGGGKAYARIWTRVGTSADGTKCSGHNNAKGLQVYFDADDLASQIGDALYMHDGKPSDVLNTTRPADDKAAHEDSPAVNTKDGNRWVEVGDGWRQ